jgi:signal peptide peptidase SppA
MTRFPHLAQRLFNAPLVLHPRKAEVVVAALAERLGITHVERLRPRIDEDEGFLVVDEGGDVGLYTGPGTTQRLGYEVAQGVALITIEGSLVHRLGTLRPYSGMTGYDGIRANFLGALADPDVRGIFLDIDSPGGEAAGCFDLVDTIYAARGDKPVWAMVDEMACSGAMAIASAADRVLTPRTGIVGSVGVVTIHMDWSDAMSEAGLKVTIITHGDRKADGNPYERLPKAVQSRIQADIDTIGALFVETIARNRGISADAVRDQEAACYLGEAGVEAGLADAVMAPDQAFAEFVASL